MGDGAAAAALHNPNFRARIVTDNGSSPRSLDALAGSGARQARGDVFPENLPRDGWRASDLSAQGERVW